MVFTKARHAVSNPTEAILTDTFIQRLESQSRRAAHLIFEVIRGSPLVLDGFTPNLWRNEARVIKERGHLLQAVAAGPVVGGGQLEDMSAGRVHLLIPDSVGRR